LKAQICKLSIDLGESLGLGVDDVDMIGLNTLDLYAKWVSFNKEEATRMTDLVIILLLFAK